AYVVFAANVHGIINVLNDISRHRLTFDPQERHQINADYAAFVAELAKFFIGFVPRKIGHAHATGMRDRYRLSRACDGFQRGVLAAMAEVHQNLFSFSFATMFRPNRLSPALRGSMQPSPTKFFKL